ncbi:hypothetical protein, partial [Cetobacterium sp.]|uniref:hypothetical protein n=1 Tax=Cetobacterium sp. TaxID=2071632 RepID=UPI003EE5E6E1
VKDKQTIDYPALIQIRWNVTQLPIIWHLYRSVDSVDSVDSLPKSIGQGTKRAFGFFRWNAVDRHPPLQLV